MKASLFNRIAAVLLLLFAVGHTVGFRQSDPSWGVDTLLGLMRSTHFDVQGFSRTLTIKEDNLDFEFRYNTVESAGAGANTAA